MRKMVTYMDSLKERICSAWKMFSLWKYRQFVLYMIAVGIAFALAFISKIMGPLESEEPFVAWVWSAMLLIGGLLLGKTAIGACLLLISLAYSGYYCWKYCLNMMWDWEWAYRMLFFFLVVILIKVVMMRVYALYNTTSQKKVEQEPDGLSRRRMYDRVHARIRLQKEGTGHTYALVGEWGSGKTHLLKYLDGRLRKAYKKEHYDDVEENISELYKGSYSIHWVTLWHYNTIETANDAITKALYNLVVGSSLRFSSKQLLGFARLGVTLFTQDADKVISALEGIVSGVDSCSDKDVETISNHLNSRNERALLFIEDIERAELSIIENLLPMIERLRKIKNLTIICALDFDELNKKCQISQRVMGSVQGYMDKIFDMSFFVPDMPQEISKRFFTQCVQDSYPECKSLLSFAKSCDIAFASPRQIRRIVTRLASIEWMYLAEADKEESVWAISPTHIFIVEILHTLYPAQYNELKETKDRKEILRSLSNNNADENGQKSAPLSYHQFQNDETFRNIILHLSNVSYSSDMQLDYAFEEKYKRRIYLEEEEALKIMQLSLNNLKDGCKELIQKFYGDSQPENIEYVEESLLRYAYEVAFIDSNPYKDMGKTFLINQLSKKERQYILNVPVGRYFSLGFSNPFSYACMESTLVHNLNNIKDTSRRKFLSILEDKLPYVDLVVLLNRLLFVQDKDFASNRHSDNMMQLNKAKDKNNFKQYLERLADTCGERMVDFVLHFNLAGETSNSIQDGTLNVYDMFRSKNNIQSIYISSVKKAISALNVSEKCTLLINLLHFLKLEVVFPPTIACHTISLIGVDMWTPLFTEIENTVFCEQLISSHKEEVAKLVDYLVNKYEVIVNNVILPEGFYPERKYIEGNKKLLHYLKKLEKKVSKNS